MAERLTRAVSATLLFGAAGAVQATTPGLAAGPVWDGVPAGLLLLGLAGMAAVLRRSLRALASAFKRRKLADLGDWQRKAAAERPAPALRAWRYGVPARPASQAAGAGHSGRRWRSARGRSRAQQARADRRPRWAYRPVARSGRSVSIP